MAATKDKGSCQASHIARGNTQVLCEEAWHSDNGWEMRSYRIVSMEDLLSGGIDAVREAIGDFSCKYNSEIDNYLNGCAVDFTRKSMTITHLVFDDRTSLCVGYFALTHKPVTFRVERLSGTQRKRIERFAKLDRNTGCYTVSAFLIAQIGKNYLAEDGNLISGVALLELAKEELLAAKRKIGGQVVFLEMEHGNDKLSKFYADNGFYLFDVRKDVENGKPITYDQLFLFLK